MENFNKVLSFVLGLVVVVVFVIVLSGRLNLRSDIFTGKRLRLQPSKLQPHHRPRRKKKKVFSSRLFSRKPKATPTPTTSVLRPSPTPIVITEKGGVQGVSEIPAAGPPTALLSLLGASTLLGFYLRRIR